MADSKPPTPVNGAEILEKSDKALQAIFYHFGKNNLSHEGAMMVLAMAYAMVIDQTPADKKADLEKLFEQLIAQTKQPRIITSGN